MTIWKENIYGKEKLCKYCKQTFIKKSTEIYDSWNKRKYCSKSCFGKSKIGSHHSMVTKQKQRESHLKGKNPMWKGKNVSYRSLHQWIVSNKFKPKFCQLCQKVSPYDITNISGKYKRDFDDWIWMCRRCHMKSDGRLNRLRLIQPIKKGTKLIKNSLDCPHCDNLLHIYTDNKGNVRRVRKGEDTIGVNH